MAVMIEPLASRDSAAVYHCDWRELLAVVPRCDALIVDAPYSERTHGAHRIMPDLGRDDIDYQPWAPEDVRAFVSAWSGRVDGWLCSLTDHVLAPVWCDALSDAGLYTFSPLACVEPGSRCRMSGDGPAQWSVWLVVARPKTRAMQRWGALVGGYVVPMSHTRRGAGERNGIMGTKPLWLMERLCEDYSRPGDLICDPCCGAGTTLVAALRTGRRAIGGDSKREHAELAAKAIMRPVQAPLVVAGRAEPEQMGIEGVGT